MNLRLIRAFGFGIAMATVIAWLFWVMTPPVRAQEESAKLMTQLPGKLIDAKARAMRADDEASIRAVTDEIFNYPHVLGRLPFALEDEVKRRLVRSEVGFLQGTRPGVREEDIVELFNILSDRLKLPEFAKTSSKQVRALRMTLVLDSPFLMGGRVTDQNIKIGESINPEMSILQAVHLSAVLLNQKFLNPNFQVPPAQWDREFHDKEIERIKEAEAIRRSGQRVEHRLAARENTKRHQLHEALSETGKALSLSDVTDIVEIALKALKVD